MTQPHRLALAVQSVVEVDQFYGCQGAVRNAPFRAGHRPQHVGGHVCCAVGRGQSGRACAEPQSRPSAPRSGGGAQRCALTAVSTRARCRLRRRQPTTTSCGRRRARNPRIPALANLRHRDRRVSGPHGRDRAVDDGPHHEQSAEPGVRPGLVRVLDYRYSIGLVYNTFPLPARFADADTSALEPLAQAVLDARSAHPGATLADLYDSDLMPPRLRRAHHVLDRAVDRLYRRQRFTSERERVEYLFALYERMQAPLATAAGVAESEASAATNVSAGPTRDGGLVRFRVGSRSVRSGRPNPIRSVTAPHRVPSGCRDRRQ